jgi:hypothetical protein
MTKIRSVVSHKHCNLGVNEGIVIYLTSKLNTCFNDGFTSKMKSQSIAYLLNGSEHIYWIMDLEGTGEVHSIWVIWTSRLQECKGNFIFRCWAKWAMGRGFIHAMKEACLGHGPTRGNWLHVDIFRFSLINFVHIILYNDE